MVFRAACTNHFLFEQLDPAPDFRGYQLGNGTLIQESSGGGWTTSPSSVEVQRFCPYLQTPLYTSLLIRPVTNAWRQRDPGFDVGALSLFNRRVISLPPSLLPRAAHRCGARLPLPVRRFQVCRRLQSGTHEGPHRWECVPVWQPPRFPIVVRSRMLSNSILPIAPMRAKFFRSMVSLTHYSWIWWASTTSMRVAAGYVPRQSRSDFQQTIMSKRPCLASASIRWNPSRFLDPPTSWWWFTMVRPKFLSQAPCRHPARTMMSCPLRLGSGVKRGRRLPPSVRPSPVGAVWSWTRFPPPDLQKLKKETRLLPGAGLRVVRVHRVTCEAQVAPRLGVLLPPLGQLVPATLPVAGLPSQTCCH